MRNVLQQLNVDWNAKLDKKIDDSIKNLLSCQAKELYTREDLHKKVNNDETLEEYIRDTEIEFNLKHADIYHMSDEQLTNYVADLDKLW